MHFLGDAFISYAHLDNVELVEGRKGWVANLHRALEVRVAQLLGKPPHIWRDPKLAGNDLFESSIVERLSRVAILVAVVSPRYLKSEWTIRELEAFWAAAEQQGGIRVHDKSRVFKVLKTPVPIDRMPPALRGLLGYEFFRVDPETGKIRELDEVFGQDAHRDFWLLLDDLAHDICGLLEVLDGEEATQAANAVSSAPPAATTSAPDPAPGAPLDRGPATSPVPAPATAAGTIAAGTAVYLAETSSDLREYREVLRRDLLQHHLRVLPDGPLPLVAEDAAAVVRDHLARCKLAIHLVGRHYGIVPEGGDQSLVELQHELAASHTGATPLTRLVWIPTELDVTDPRQQQVLERLRLDPRVGTNADLLETYFEDFRTTLQQWLRRPRPIPTATTPPSMPAASPAATAAPAPTEPPAASSPAPAHPIGAMHVQAAPARVYLVADERDVAALDPWANWLFDRGSEVTRSNYEGTESEIREYHEENLATSDAVIIFFGSGNEPWVRRKLRELQKSAAISRPGTRPATAVCLIGAHTAEKDRFRTHDATVIPQWSGVDADALTPFLATLEGAGGR